MTEHQTLNTVIHAAFRRDLARFDHAFKDFRPGTSDRAQALGRAWDNFADQLHHHHEDEETIFWPAMTAVGVDAALMSDLDGEHQRMSDALDAASAAMAEFQVDPSPERLQTARGAVGALGAIVEEHLVHEERDLEPLSALHKKSGPMKAAQKEVRKANKGRAGVFFAWLQDGADGDAKAALRKEIPPPVLYVMSHVGGRSYFSDIAPVWT